MVQKNAFSQLLIKSIFYYSKNVRKLKCRISTISCQNLPELGIDDMHPQ